MHFLEVYLTKEECEEIRWQDGYASKAYETALKMKEDNMPVEAIEKYTGLSIEEI